MAAQRNEPYRRSAASSFRWLPLPEPLPGGRGRGTLLAHSSIVGSERRAQQRDGRKDRNESDAPAYNDWE